MKKKETNEENMFQKYDDLFDQQDRKYDTNNSSRYAKKKNTRSEDVEYQRYEPKKTESTKVNKNIAYLLIFVLLAVSLFTVGIIDLGFLREIPTFVIIGVIAVVASAFRKNKKK